MPGWGRFDGDDDSRMSVAIITGSAGLVGSEAVRFFANQGMDVVGVDNDMRKRFFGPAASTDWNRRLLEEEVAAYRHVDLDIRDERRIQQTFSQYGRDVSLVIHAAGQPSHDWAGQDPVTDFSVNATGTLQLLEAARRYAPDAVFIFVSTNKVYGDTPNKLPLRELATRYEIEAGHSFEDGIGETMSIDTSMHSLLGASKLAADVLVQEYGKYFGMRTGVFRAGCITGPRHSGAVLHGFLAYLFKCVVTGEHYRVFGYKGKQVRDNIHAWDLVNAFDHFFRNPRAGEVYNIGGGRESNCSVLEAISLCQEIAGRDLKWEYVHEPRRGDHQWWISNLTKFRSHHPKWNIQFGVREILEESLKINADRWVGPQASFKRVAIPRRTSILGVEISRIDSRGAAELVVEWARHREPRIVSALAVHGVMTGVLDHDHRQRLNSFDLLTADGQPVRWALNWIARLEPLRDRVAGTELTLKICAAAARDAVGIYLYGSRPEVVNAMASRLRATYPDLKIVGVRASRFRAATPEEDAADVDAINGSGAGVVFVGLGCPLQEKWAYEHVTHIRPVMVCVGAAFDFLSGQLRRAPRWMQRVGLEWLFRLAQEPRRLWRRYAHYNALFVAMLLLQLASLKASGRHRS